MTARITDFFHSRYAAFAAVAVMIAAAWSAFAAGNPANLPVDPGPALPPRHDMTRICMQHRSITGMYTANDSWVAAPADMRTNTRKTSRRCVGIM